MYGALVREARSARGMSQVLLAELSGVEQANISAIERDRRMPSAATLHRLLHACGFELTASAGPLVLACPPPVEGDDLLDALGQPSELDQPPTVDTSTPIEDRVRVLTAALEAAEAIVRSR